MIKNSNHIYVKSKCCIVSWYDHEDDIYEDRTFLMSEYKKAKAMYNKLLADGYEDVEIVEDILLDILTDKSEAL